MFDNLDYEIISKTQTDNKILQDTVSDDLFAKTISYSGIQNNFHIDIPEILSYEKQLEDRKNDIKKFTELAMSDLDNLSHNDLVMEIYKNDFYGSEFESEIISELSENERLLKDLGL